MAELFLSDAPVHPDIHVRRAPFAASMLQIAEIEQNIKIKAHLRQDAAYVPCTPEDNI